MFYDYPALDRGIGAAGEEGSLCGGFCGEEAFPYGGGCFYGKVVGDKKDMPDLPGKEGWERHPKRLERLLSGLLGEEVKLCRVLEEEEGGSAGPVSVSLLAKLPSGTGCRVEIRRGLCRCGRQRAEERGPGQGYSRIYTIVILERGCGLLLGRDGHSVHRFSCAADIGLPVKLLQEYLFLSAEAFREKVRAISGRQEA